MSDVTPGAHPAEPPLGDEDVLRAELRRGLAIRAAVLLALTVLLVVFGGDGLYLLVVLPPILVAGFGIAAAYRRTFNPSASIPRLEPGLDLVDRVVEQGGVPERSQARRLTPEEIRMSIGEALDRIEGEAGPAWSRRFGKWPVRAVSFAGVGAWGAGLAWMVANGSWEGSLFAALGVLMFGWLWWEAERGMRNAETAVELLEAQQRRLDGGEEYRDEPAGPGASDALPGPVGRRP